MSFYQGAIDEVRLSRIARYTGQSFQPSRRLGPDQDTVALYTFDRTLGAYILDESGHGHHARPLGSPTPVPVPQ